jgi:Ca2+-binding EF-hand superfamily protein
MPHQEKVQLIIDELDKDISGSRGLDNIKARLAFLGFHLTRDFISDIMHELKLKALTIASPGLRRS